MPPATEGTLLSRTAPSEAVAGPASGAAGRTSRQVDDCVGQRIRHRRSEFGWTQDRLARKLAISCQRVQKYETGANRVNAGRLHPIAMCLDAGVGYFFERAALSSVTAPLEQGGGNRVTIELVRNFTEISSEQIRSALSGLIKALSEPG